MSPAAKWEYMKTVYPRYHQANRIEKKRILDEFCKTYGCHRKHAIRLLNGPIPSEHRPRRRGLRTYSNEVLAILQDIWEAAGYPWSARLKALLPVWLPWIKKRFRLTPVQEKQLLFISPAQMDRRLAHVKHRLRKRIYGKTKSGTLLKHHIPIKTDCWDVKRPGFLEIDLVSHSGNSSSGEYAYTLDATDIHTGWTEVVTLLGKSQEAVRDAMKLLEEAFPFPIRGLDSDNGSEFINDHLWRWSQDRKIQFTRGRPYKKDDNAHIEQKNWTHIRKLYGYVRYDTQDVVDAMNDLNRNELRLFQNLFLPSTKLKRKVRIGSKLTRRYHAPQMPWTRVLASRDRDRRKVAALQTLLTNLNPFDLGKTVDHKLAAIYRMSSTPQRHSSRPLPKILPAWHPAPHQQPKVHDVWRDPFVPRSTLSHNLIEDRDNPVLKFTKLHEKEKFLAAG
jgi:hypothetical protein